MTKIAIVLLSMMLPLPAAAQGARQSSAVEMAIDAGDLKPGQWVWAPQIAPEGPIMVYVNLERQLATVFRNGVRIGVSTISSGKPGYETPVGVFTILQKDAKHRSSTYNNAPMPYQQRLTWDGVALHAGGLPGYPESHGCVHLPMEFARLLFGATHMGMTVVVAGRAGKASFTPRAGVVAMLDPVGQMDVHTPLSDGEAWRWQPELSPTGPLTVIISRADQRMVVLRNGKEIGRARIAIGQAETETRVFTRITNDQGEDRWLQVSVPGHGGTAPTEGPTYARDVLDLKMPGRFQALLAAELTTGATMLVTRAPVLPSTSGQRLTVMAASKS